MKVRFSAVLNCYINSSKSIIQALFACINSTQKVRLSSFREGIGKNVRYDENIRENVNDFEKC